MVSSSVILAVFARHYVTVFWKVKFLNLGGFMLIGIIFMLQSCILQVQLQSHVLSGHSAVHVALMQTELCRFWKLNVEWNYFGNSK